MNKKLLSYISSNAIGIITLLIVCVIAFSGNKITFGGTTNYDQIDTTDGYSVDGTSVINGSGVITGVITSANTVTLTGKFNPDSIKSGVSIGSAVPTSTISAANICDKGIIEVSPTVANASTTLDTAVNLQADCLGNVGSYTDVLLENTSNAASTTIIAAGASSTLEFAASSTIAGATLAGGDGAILRFYSSTSTTSNSAMIKVKIIHFDD